MRSISSAFAALALFIASAQAGKRGLCWPYYNKPLDPSVFNNGDGQVVAIYDYETYAPVSTNGSDGLEFIGMQRCMNCDSSPIDQLATRQMQQGWTTVFTLNEPDVNGITPAQAAAWYQQYVNPLAVKKALPAVTSSTSAGEGRDWLFQMIGECARECDYDYVNLHWYGASFEEFENYIRLAHSDFPNKPIIITEFALQNPPGGETDQANFFAQAFAFLDSQPFVELYFPFVATSPDLLLANDPFGAVFSGTGSCLYTNEGGPSAVGNLMF